RGARRSATFQYCHAEPKAKHLRFFASLRMTMQVRMTSVGRDGARPSSIVMLSRRRSISDSSLALRMTGGIEGEAPAEPFYAGVGKVARELRKIMLG
ncbi:MAG: hypothetical protein RMM06_07805, partial [Armatimonadota bacterium]|nr:hypothetical protein [Armatimonadota bacterium]